MQGATLTVAASACRGDVADDELVAATRAGDDRAFEALYARYQRRIGAYVLGMVKDHQRAEDVTQEVFLSALRRMRKTDRELAFKPWLYEIAKNACIDQFRRSRRGEEVSIDAEDGVGSLVSGGPTPDIAADARQELDHLRDAFVGLNESHHRILVLRELEGRSYAEIGERMGMTRPAVESTLHRARKRLASEYDELVSGERCRRVQAIIAGASEGSLGTRDQRRMARHVSYCQPCRRVATRAGLGELVPARVGVRAKVAGLLPLPAVLRDRWLGIGADPVAASGSSLGGWLHATAPVLDSGGSGWLKAVATAATVVVAGLGSGVVADQRPPGTGHAPGAAGLLAALSGSGSGAADRAAASASATAPSRPAGTRTAAVTRRAAPAARSGQPATAPPSSRAPAPAPFAAPSTPAPARTPARTPGAAGPAPTGMAPAPAAVTETAQDGRRGIGGVVGAVVPPVSTPAPAVGDTAVEVPAPQDVIQTVDETVQQVTGVVGDVTSGLAGAPQSPDDALGLGG